MKFQILLFAFVAFVVRCRPAALAALTLLLLSPTARADEILGCVGERKGILRGVASLSQCKASETPISWNAEGVKGDEGDPGEDGAPGANGSDAKEPHVFDGAGRDLGISFPVHRRIKIRLTSLA